MHSLIFFKKEGIYKSLTGVIISVHPETLIFLSPSMGEGEVGGDNDWKY
jgi:hypothetical protein